MYRTPSAVQYAAKNSTLVSSGQHAQAEGRPPRAQTLMRRYEVAHLAANGDIADFSQIAPAIPVFEEAFSAFARGTLIQTDQGPIAIEDLLPGDKISTADGGHLPLLWKGTIQIVPGRDAQMGGSDVLTRIAADTFGFSRPTNDAVLGPSARLFYGAPSIRAVTGRDGAFIPARDFVDAGNVVAIRPATSVQVFHLCLSKHARIIAGGLEVESYHPDSTARFALRGEMLNLFLSLFPHMKSLEDFGMTAFPRLTMQDLDLMDSA